MTRQERMRAALAAADADITSLGRQFAGYFEELHVQSQEAYRSANGKNAIAHLNEALGEERIARALLGRLHAEGLGWVLQHARGAAALDAVGGTLEDLVALPIARLVSDAPARNQEVSDGE